MRMASASVVPGIGTFRTGDVKPLQRPQLLTPGQFFQQYADGGTHYPGPDEDQVNVRVGGMVLFSHTAK